MHEEPGLHNWAFPPSRTEWAVARLRKAIMSGEFRPGDRILAEELAKRWSISATPIREACQRLAAEGLVVYTAQRGARVAPLSLEDMKDLYELRLLLEPMALRDSVRRADEWWEGEIRGAYEQLARWHHGRPGPDLGDDVEAYEEDHMAFHRALLSQCRSPRLRQIVDALRLHSQRYRLLSWPGRRTFEEAMAEHAALYAACRAREADRAYELCREHIRATYDHAVATAGTEGVVEGAEGDVEAMTEWSCVAEADEGTSSRA
jgi:GntR family carbon starvation induced transcriptional regulator